MLATCFRHAHAIRKPGLQPRLQLARIMECGLATTCVDTKVTGPDSCRESTPAGPKSMRYTKLLLHRRGTSDRHSLVRFRSLPQISTVPNRWMTASSNISCKLCLKKLATHLASCSFDKHGLILIIFDTRLTISSAIAKRPRDASSLSVVSFNSTKRRAQSFIVSYVSYRFVTAYD